MHDDYSGLSRAYTTAPTQAIQEIFSRIEQLYATVNVAAVALKSHQLCESETVEIVLTRASDDLYQLQAEVNHLSKQLKGGVDDE